MRQGWRQLRGVSASLVAVGLVLSIFSGSARAEVDEVRIAVQYGLAFLPFHVAQARGLFARQAKLAGLDTRVVLQQVASPTAINDALLSGSVAMGVYGMPSFLIAWDKTRANMSIKGLASTNLISCTLNTVNPAVHSLTDFTDKDRIAVTAPTASQSIILRMAAEKTFGAGQFARLDALMVSRSHPDSVAALLNKTEIDAYFSCPPYTSVVQQDHRVHTVLTTEEVLGQPVSGNVVATTQQFADRNPKATASVLAALDKAMAFIAQHRSEAARIYLDAEHPKLSQDEVEGLLAQPFCTFAAAPQGLMLFANYLARTGQIRTRPQDWKETFLPLLHDRAGS